MALQLEFKKMIKEFKEELKEVLGEKFMDLILFGSYARGDFSTDSDIDLLLIVKERLSSEEKERVSSICATFSLKYDIVISCFDYPYDVFNRYNTPFLLNVKDEGVKI